MPNDPRIAEARRLAKEANETAKKFIEDGLKIESKPVREIINDLSKAIEQITDYLEKS